MNRIVPLATLAALLAATAPAQEPLELGDFQRRLDELEAEYVAAHQAGDVARKREIHQQIADLSLAGGDRKAPDATLPDLTARPVVFVEEGPAGLGLGVDASRRPGRTEATDAVEESPLWRSLRALERADRRAERAKSGLHRFRAGDSRFRVLGSRSERVVEIDRHFPAARSIEVVRDESGRTEPVPSEKAFPAAGESVVLLIGRSPRRYHFLANHGGGHYTLGELVDSPTTEVGVRRAYPDLSDFMVRPVAEAGAERNRHILRSMLQGIDPVEASGRFAAWARYRNIYVLSVAIVSGAGGLFSAGANEAISSGVATAIELTD